MKPFDELAWLLTERWRDGSEHIEGIALTHEAASAWVGGFLEDGHAKTSMPYPIIALPRSREPAEAIPAAVKTTKGGLEIP